MNLNRVVDLHDIEFINTYAFNYDDLASYCQDQTRCSQDDIEALYSRVNDLSAAAELTEALGDGNAANALILAYLNSDQIDRSMSDRHNIIEAVSALTAKLESAAKSLIEDL